MKIKILLSFLFAITIMPVLVQSQCYTVLSVKGEIVLEKTGKPIKEMDEICSTDKLIFSSPDSRAAVLSPEQGRFNIKISPSKKTNALIEYLKAVLSPGTGRLSSKGAKSLEEEFGDKYFVIGTGRVLVDSNYFIMNDKFYFYLRYTYEGNNVNKKLKFSSDTLIINKSEIYSFNHREVDPDSIEDVSLFYYQKEKNTSTKVTSFKLSFADESKLFDELSKYISLLRNARRDNEFITEEVMLYVADVYGNINENDFKAWLRANFDIE